MTENMKVMFLIGFIIFVGYIYALIKAIMWGHKSQEEERLNDPELRNYYSRHGMPDVMDYDGHGYWDDFLITLMKKNLKEKKEAKVERRIIFGMKKINNCYEYRSIKWRTIR